MNPVGIGHGAGSLLAAAERANRIAPRMLSHILTDLTLSEGQRLSDEVRSVWHLLRGNAIDEAERGLRDHIAAKLEIQDGEVAIVELIESPQSLVRDILDRGHFPEQPALSAALLEQAANTVLRRNLSMRARLAGEDDPVRRMSRETTEQGQWATALLLAQSIAEGPDAAPILPAEQHHALIWSVAAALRVALSLAARNVQDLDDYVASAVAALLASHDEGRAVDAIAARLARLAEEQIDAPAALIAGYPELSAALLGRTTGIDRSLISAIQHESDGARLAIVMRAADVERDAAARVFLTLSETLGGRGDVGALIGAGGPSMAPHGQSGQRGGQRRSAARAHPAMPLQ